MADIYSATTAEIATGTAVKTILEVEGPATRPRLELLAIELTFEGVVVTDLPIEVELVSKSADGTSAASPPAAVPEDAGAPASACTIRHNCSAEGTVGVVYRRWKIHPQSGIIYPFTFTQPIKMAVATPFAIRTTAGTSVGCIAHARWLE